eukprot:3656359-Ditylum_brightwellii.AAC.1
MFYQHTSHEDKDDELQPWPDAVEPSETTVVKEVKEEEEAKNEDKLVVTSEGENEGMTMKRL